MKSLIALAALFISSSFAAAQDTPLVDGRLDPNEWPIATDGAIPEAGEVLLAEDGGRLCLGLRAERLAMVNLLLWKGDEIRILHRSGSLGRATYQRGEEDLWNRSEDFEWRLRGMGGKPARPQVAAALRKRLAAKAEGSGSAATAPRPEPKTEPATASAEEQRAAIEDHFLEMGWTAATAPMSAPHSAELCLSTEGLEGWRMIVQWSHVRDGGMAIGEWPEGATALPRDGLRELLFGKAPESLSFDLQGGYQVEPPG